MDRIEVTRAFRHADDGIHATETVPGTYEVAENPVTGQVSPRRAEVALAEGWAVPAGQGEGKANAARPSGSPTGGEKPASSSRPARRSGGKTSKKRGG